MLSPLALEWLAYARSIFSCNFHHVGCDAPRIANIDTSLRWPGFVGEAYEAAPKKLLLVGRIHNPSGWTCVDGLTLLQPLVHGWLQGRLTDEAFYPRYGKQYAELLKTWGPWHKVFRRLARAAGVDEKGVAYCNVAKCWEYPGRETSKQRKCSREFPLEALVQILKPNGVFLLATDKWVSRVPGVRVSVPFRNDSAPHFRIPEDRLVTHQAWIKTLSDGPQAASRHS